MIGQEPKHVRHVLRTPIRVKVRDDLVLNCGGYCAHGGQIRFDTARNPAYHNQFALLRVRGRIVQQVLQSGHTAAQQPYNDH